MLAYFARRNLIMGNLEVAHEFNLPRALHHPNNAFFAAATCRKSQRTMPPRYTDGTVYENCTQPGSQCAAPCGYAPNTFSLYTSTDLESFTLQSTNIMPNMTIDNHEVDYWMPVVAFNAKTSLYYMQYWSGRCGFAKPCADIAVASSPYGPFTMVPPLQLTTPASSQMGFFADETTGKAYVKYNTVGPQHHVIEELSDDWLSTTGNYAILFWRVEFAWMEGGGMFKNGDLYYYMTGTGAWLTRGAGRRRIGLDKEEVYLTRGL